MDKRFITLILLILLFSEVASAARPSDSNSKSNYGDRQGYENQNVTTAGFSASPTSGNVPLYVQFTDQSTGSPTSWAWNFGDGSTSNLQSPSCIYTQAGTYTVTLTALNANGVSSKSAQIIVSALVVPTPVVPTPVVPTPVVPTPVVPTPVVPTPVAAFTTSVTTGTAPATITFTDLSTGSPTSWFWSFGDGSTSTLENPAHVYTQAGTYTVTLTATNGADSNTATKSDYIVVTAFNPPVSTPTITWNNPADITYGTPLGSTQLNAVASVPGTFTYNPQVGTVLNAGTQTLHVDFRPTDTANYNTASKDVTIKVTNVIQKRTPTITWNNPADITYGIALSATQLNAVASVPGTYVYTPVAGTVLNAGTQTLHVGFTPTDTANYNTASKDVTIKVTNVIQKRTPTITWNNPADITYGIALSATQLNAVASVPGTYVYTPVAGTVLNAGTQTLHVGFTPTDTANYNTASKDVTINVINVIQKTTPSILWINPADITHGTALNGTQLNAVATDPTTGSTVPGNFYYNPPAGTILNAGNHQRLHVDFTPTDTANYNTASKDVTINVKKTTPAILWINPAGITHGTALNGTQLNAVATDPTTGSTVPGNFYYNPPAGTILNAGNNQTLHVDFTPSDTANYNTASKDVTINVNKATPSITWNNPADVTYGIALNSTQLNANTSVLGTFNYSPPAGTILSVGNNQTLHVDFTPSDTANYNAASKDVTINVNKATPSITWNNPADVTYGIALNSTQLNANTSVLGTFNYSPPAGTILSVGNNQTLHVDFTPTDTANYNAASKDVTINVNKATPSITWNNPADVTYGIALNSTQLNANTSVLGTFNYSPPAGTILSVGNNQTLHVDFTPSDTANYNTASKDVTINVNKATPSITWNNPADVTYGIALNSTQLNANTSVLGTFNYSPPAGTILSVGNNQTLHVDFTPTDTANYNTASKDVTINVNKATPSITWNNPADVTYGIALNSTQLNANTSVLGTFNYSPPAGTILSVGNNQTLHVDFTPTDTANYNAASKDVTINVNKATPSITWNNPADVTYGIALNSTQLNANTSVLGTFNYSPPAGTILSVGNNQTLHVDFTPTDTANYNTASKDVTINVNKATPSITWNNPADVTYGIALNSTQLNANTSVLGTFNYSPPAGTILSVGNNQTLHVDFTPTDTANYNAASKDVTINVNKATPSITWNNPADVTYGIALNSTQLNANTSVLGTFNYSPPAGTILSVGNNQTLHVDFTPTDTANYNAASKDVTINVNKATPSITWNNPADVTYGIALNSTQLNANTSVLGTFNYSPPAGTILSVGNNQTLHVDFTPTDTANYNTASKDVTINVTTIQKTTPTITWNNPAAIAYGKLLSSKQLNAKASVRGTFVYTPSAGTALAIGSQVLKVEFTPKNAKKYTTATQTVRINVVTVPLASFSAFPTSGKAPLPVTFTDTSTGSPSTWTWKFGDGRSRTSKIPYIAAHTYKKKGKYTVTLTVKNAAGSNKAKQTRYIIVK